MTIEGMGSSRNSPAFFLGPAILSSLVDCDTGCVTRMLPPGLSDPRTLRPSDPVFGFGAEIASLDRNSNRSKGIDRTPDHGALGLCRSCSFAHVLGRRVPLPNSRTRMQTRTQVPTANTLAFPSLLPQHSLCFNRPLSLPHLLVLPYVLLLCLHLLPLPSPRIGRHSQANWPWHRQGLGGAADRPVGRGAESRKGKGKGECQGVMGKAKKTWGVPRAEGRPRVIEWSDRAANRVESSRVVEEFLRFDTGRRQVHGELHRVRRPASLLFPACAPCSPCSPCSHC